MKRTRGLGLRGNFVKDTQAKLGNASSAWNTVPAGLGDLANNIVIRPITEVSGVHIAKLVSKEDPSIGRGAGSTNVGSVAKGASLIDAQDPA